MNLRNIIVLILGGIFILGVGISAYIFSKKEILPNITVQEKIDSKELSAETIALLESYKGITPSGTIKGYKTYTNKKYGFQFSYPKEYTLGDNILRYPVDLEEELGKFWLNNPASDYGNNGSISINILNSKEYPVGSYDKMMMKKQISIAGQPAYFYDVKQHFPESEGYQFLLYVITLPSHSGKYLGITFHGYLANLLTQNQIDEMIKTIKWLPIK